MRDENPRPAKKPPIQAAANHAKGRREAAKRLGLEMAKRHEALALAAGTEEVHMRAVELGGLFNDNIAFVCWVLKEYGGIDQMPFQPERRPALPKLPDNLVN